MRTARRVESARFPAAPSQTSWRWLQGSKLVDVVSDSVPVHLIASWTQKARLGI